MRIKGNKGRKKWICQECKAVHRYHFRVCGKCKAPNPNKQKYKVLRDRKPEVGDEQIGTLVAMVHSMQSCTCSSDRKAILKSNLKRNPFIELILRITYDPSIHIGFKIGDLKRYPSEYGFGSNIRDILKSNIKKQSGRGLSAGRWNGMLHRLPTSFREVVNGVLEGRFNMGLNLKAINEVFERLHLKPIRRK